MKTVNLSPPDLSGVAPCEILIGKTWYLYAGTAHIEGALGWSMINFFLGGIYDGQLGKLIVPNDFPVITRWK